MPSTLGHVASVLSALEDKHVEALRETYSRAGHLKPHLSGSVQCFALSGPRTNLDKPLPVVCAVGINYTQEQRRGENLRRYHEDGVLQQTASSAKVLSVVAAYERNRQTWISRKARDPESPLEFYGSPEATRKTGPIFRGGFLYVMTNLCPFITAERWGRQSDDLSRQILDFSRPFAHLDDLYDALGESIDLWIGHSAMPGTRWVWPEFAAFVRRRGIREWLLTFNIQGMSDRWFEGTLRTKTQPRPWLYDWYGPEMET